MNERELFLKHLAQTSTEPLALEIVKAEEVFLYDKRGKKYIDLVGGISVANIGHRHPDVIKAIHDQAAAYLHIMVYGEFIESPQVQFATKLVSLLPAKLNSVYFTNSGAEAVEGAMKLAKRVTNRTGIISFERSYHGSTQGALSIMGDEQWRNAFRPLLPGISHFTYNDDKVLQHINEDTACVILETIQAETGIITPDRDWLRALRKRCADKGALLILDEIQAGFGRTGKLWAFEHFDIVPDILLLGKALGGGMPLGAFISDRKLMSTLSHDPALGHITTFGGHPVSCAAGHAALNVLLNEKIIDDVENKNRLFKSLLVHHEIRSVRSCGLWMAVEFESFEKNKKVIGRCIENGVFTDWFLFAPECMRISPPLLISDQQIKEAAAIIIKSLN